MKSNYDFSNGKKNPYAGKFNDGYTFIIHHDSPDGGWDEVSKVKPEDINTEIEKDKARYAAKKKERLTQPAAN